MQTNFDAAAQFTASREGLYQCRRSDPGNWTSGVVSQGRLVGTMRGISAPVLVSWLGSAELVTDRVMKALTQGDFEAIARALYWRALHADALPSGLDLMLFDFGFNSGVARAAKQLQRIVGVDPIDGDIGEETLEAIGGRARISDIVCSMSERYRKRLQDDLGVAPDGVIGPVTLSALLAEAPDQGGRVRALIYACASQQEAAYRSFRDFQASGAGWLARLDARVAMALRLLPATADRRVPALT